MADEVGERPQREGAVLKVNVGDFVLIYVYTNAIVGRVVWTKDAAVLVKVPLWPLPRVVYAEDILDVGTERELDALSKAVTMEVRKREAAWEAARKNLDVLADQLNNPEIKTLIDQLKREAMAE